MVHFSDGIKSFVQGVQGFEQGLAEGALAL